MRCPIENGEGEVLLDSVRSASLEDHIRGCAACGEFVAAQMATDGSLELWDAPPVSIDFDRRLYSRIAKEVPWWESLVRPFRPVFARRLVPIMAAAGLLIAAGLWLDRPGSMPPPPESAEVQPLPPDQAEHALQDMETIQEFSRLIHADAAEPRL